MSSKKSNSARRKETRNQVSDHKITGTQRGSFDVKAEPQLPWPVEMLSPRSLRPAPRNARTHSARQIRQIADSMVRFGFVNPLVVDDHGRIVAGHARAEAAKLIGLKKVPVIRLSHLSEAEVRAYMLADNKLAEKPGGTARCWRWSWRTSRSPSPKSGSTSASPGSSRGRST